MIFSREKKNIFYRHHQFLSSLWISPSVVVKTHARKAAIIVVFILFYNCTNPVMLSKLGRLLYREVLSLTLTVVFYDISLLLKALFGSGHKAGKLLFIKKIKNKKL